MMKADMMRARLVDLLNRLGIKHHEQIMND